MEDNTSTTAPTPLDWPALEERLCARLRELQATVTFGESEPGPGGYRVYAVRVMPGGKKKLFHFDLGYKVDLEDPEQKGRMYDVILEDYWPWRASELRRFFGLRELQLGDVVRTPRGDLLRIINFVGGRVHVAALEELEYSANLRFEDYAYDELEFVSKGQ